MICAREPFHHDSDKTKLRIRTNFPNYIKDTETGAVLNTDLTGYQAIVQARKNKNLIPRIDALEREVASLRTIINQLLQEIAKE